MLTNEQRAVLAHIVVDPDEWAAHALATVGQAAIDAKVARWRPAYEAALAAEGVAYQTRAQREAAS
jgi:hypothetical protein